MLDKIESYPNAGHFFFEPQHNLAEVCNAPKQGGGVYYIYALHHGRVDLYYIGSSGKVATDGSWEAATDGLWGTIVNTPQFGKSRNDFWSSVMKRLEIEAFDVYWSVTYDDEVQDDPVPLEKGMMQRHCEIYGERPPLNLY